MAWFEARDIVSGYGHTDVLHGVSLRLDRDEIVTIIGPNGAGKSTLFKTVMGYLTPRSGKVLFRDEDVTDLGPHVKVAKGIAYVPQLDNIFSSLTVRENLEMGGYSKERDAMEQAIERSYDTFPVLKERRKQRARVLSGGERQMLAMSIAMMTEPALLLLDEPSAGLAPKVAEEVFAQIEALHQHGIGILIVEQDAHRSLSISNRGYVLVMGRNYFDGSADAILTNSQIRDAFLGV